MSSRSRLSEERDAGRVAVHVALAADGADFARGEESGEGDEAAAGC